MSEDSCGECGATGVRLFRPYSEFFRAGRVRCGPCARTEPLGQYGGNDDTEIGWYVPLIQCDDGDYWGYTSIPEAALAAWKQLPEVRS